MVQRIHYRGSCHYNTRSNQVRVVRTPGGKRRYLDVKKTANPARCGDCKIVLPGVPAVRSWEMKRIPKCKRSVSRVYGGNKCHKCVSERVKRAFLIEEQKIVRAISTRREKQKADK
ncbi:MAG: uncharacterized protein KVP18_000452 [Porospora cf. gigantea A]|uniref:uncharacterized protein n=1 Tax=Porospora cf. gigantea A TaxID=2853593 RepID=UPI0035595375|nr:MAG: hypothetical protein KVP18_000452 [Porospora cf. gigantea A]